jgi:AcrR family transcriptional regulator
MAKQRTLTREDFVTAALEFIDAHGAAMLTATTLGEVMGVHQTAVYRHLPSMEDLHGAILDRLFGEIVDRPIPKGTPRARLRAHAMNVHHVFYEHPNTLVLVLSTRGHLPNADRLSRLALQLLRDLGLTGQRLVLCHQMLESYVGGTHVYDLGGAPHHLEMRRQRRRLIDDADIDRSTPTTESVDALNRNVFTTGLDVLLDFCESQATAKR